MRAEVFLQGLISFLIVAFGQPSFSPILAPVAGALGYALFWRAIRIYPFKKQRFWRGTLWYGSVMLIQLSWMSSIQFQGVYILIVWFSLALWLGVQFGLLTLLIPYNRPLKIPRILAIASVWTLIEWSRYHILCGYSWNLSGLALSHTYAMQAAVIFGVLGLSFWVIFVNLLGYRALTRKGIIHYLVWGAAACIPYLFGISHIAYHDRKISQIQNPAPYSCLLVQTGLLPSEKIPLQGQFRYFVSPYDQWERILQFVQKGQTERPDLVVLPEAAVPFSSSLEIYEKKKVKAIFFEVFGQEVAAAFPPSQYEKVTNSFWVQTLANHLGSEIVIGLDHVDEEGRSYNSAFHAKPQNQPLCRYDKRVLMPLAEYLPFQWLIPLVKSYGITGFFTHGKEVHPFLGKLPLSPSICYEETFPHKVREGRLAGGKLLVNMTNDGWYPYSRLPSQHFEHAKYRAVENGTPLIRACNTGVTAAVDSLGRTIDSLPPHDKTKKPQPGVLFASFVPYEYSTLYMVWGDYGILCLSLLFIGFFLLLKKPMRW